MNHYVNNVRVQTTLAHVGTHPDLAAVTLYAVAVLECGTVIATAASVVTHASGHGFAVSDVLEATGLANVGGVYVTANPSDALIYRFWAEQFLAAFGKGKMVLEFSDYGERGGKSVKEYAARDALVAMWELTTGRYPYRPSELPTTREAAARAMAEQCEGECGVRIHLTRKAFRAAGDDARRVKLEETAAGFLATHKLARIDSPEFVRAARKAIRRLSDRRRDHFGGEQRAERYGAHAANGSREAFWSDEDYASGEFDREADRLQEVLTYVRQRFPLFWAGYQEARRAKKAQKAAK